MATWTMDQVRQASRLRAHLEVDDALIARDPENVKSAAEDELAKKVTSMGHPFGLEINRADLEAAWTVDDSKPWVVTGTMRWKPPVATAELRGGHLDGQRWALRKVGEPLRVPIQTMTPWFDTDATEATAATVDMSVTYELVGWREDERVWVYEAK